MQFYNCLYAKSELLSRIVWRAKIVFCAFTLLVSEKVCWSCFLLLMALPSLRDTFLHSRQSESPIYECL